MNWRHRVALIEQWNRVNLGLTSKVLLFMYGTSFPELKIGEIKTTSCFLFFLIYISLVSFVLFLYAILMIKINIPQLEITF